jgi:ElaB/YqjD/DUF883 family membrane-anchored ribosome-binding protein
MNRFVGHPQDNENEEDILAQFSELNAGRDAAKEAFDKVVADFRELTHKFDNLVKSGNASLDELRELKDEASSRIGEAKDIVGEATAQARYGTVKAVRYAAAASNEYVHENPWSTLSVAGGIGLLLGLLLARRH